MMKPANPSPDPDAQPSCNWNGAIPVQPKPSIGPLAGCNRSFLLVAVLETPPLLLLLVVVMMMMMLTHPSRRVA